MFAAADYPAYGVAFINSAEEQVSEQRWSNALASGAAWDRYPLYWFYIETSEGVFDWSKQDLAIQSNVDHGVQLDAILLGTPAFYRSNTLRDLVLPYRHRDRPGKLFLDVVERATPSGLHEPVFTDGDIPGPGKVINPANKWAVFVETAVNRYKPGGLLAATNNWPNGAGVTVWEMWNEADLPFFWDAGVGDYARLLKVGFLAAKHADPGAQVMFSGLAMWQIPDYYDQVLSVLDSDSQSADYDYFHDLMAIHNYSRPERTAVYVQNIRSTMQSRGMDKAIWLNESGVPAWDDYPGPIWEPLSPLRATQEEMAAFTIQNAFHGFAAGLDGLFHFQLYDGCGNQPAGTDFPPHDGSLCDENNEYNGKPCAGDAYGMYRNPQNAACFSQHPQPETARPVFDAYHVLTTYVRAIEPYWHERRGTPVYTPSCPWTDGTQEWIALYQPEMKKRIVGLWARCGHEETAVIEATDPNGVALLVAQDGTTQEITAVDGFYAISLPGATNRNPSPGSSINPVYGIGGRPSILIETDYRGQDPTPTATGTATTTATSTVTPTPTAATTATATIPANCVDLILNGGFEENLAWQVPNTAYPAQYSDEQAHAGQRAMRAGITDPDDNILSYSTTTQSVVLPDGVAELKLRFWLYTSSSEPASFILPADLLAPIVTDLSQESDVQMVLILDSSGQVIERLIVDRLDERQWMPYTFDLAHLAGQTVQVYFSVANNGTGGVTGMYIDDVTLSSCAEDNPTSTPISSPTATATVTSPETGFQFYIPAFIKEASPGVSARTQD